MYKRESQRGASLIETMVALFVLAIGLLGFAALLTNSLTMNQRAFTLSQAVFIANNLTERIRMNRDSAASYGILKTQELSGTPTDCTSNTCTATQMAQWDLKEWFDLLESSIPGADAEITISTTVGGETAVRVDLHYELQVGRAGSGSASEVANMAALIQPLNIYSLSTEL